MSGPADYENDDASGFARIEAREIDTIGMLPSITYRRSIYTSLSQARTVSSRKSARPSAISPSTSPLTYASPSPSHQDLANIHPQIDSIDPAFAPATGTPETGGWSTRELRTILRGLDGLHIVSADIVEVAPAYDTNAELTTMAAADVSYLPAIISTARLPFPAGAFRGNECDGQDPSRKGGCLNDFLIF